MKVAHQPLHSSIRVNWEFSSNCAIRFDSGGMIIGICKVFLGFHLGSTFGLVGVPKRIFCIKLVVALINKMFLIFSVKAF